MKNKIFEDAYLALIKDNRIVDSPLQESASIIARECALAADVSRASVWVSQGDTSVLHCLSLYSAVKDSYESGATLAKNTFPKYFQALANERVIDASNALQDSRTSELAETYLLPLGVQSLLDATIRQHGNVIGVICLEMADAQRNWTRDEQVFIASIADFISQRIVVDELNRSEATYKTLFENTIEGAVILNEGRFADVNPSFCSLFNSDAQELIGLTPVDLSPEYQPDGQLSSHKVLNLAEQCTDGEAKRIEWLHKRLDGTEFLAEVTIGAVKISGKDILFGSVRDISARKEAESKVALAQEKLMFRAAHDSLTGLLNRDQLHTHVNTIINNTIGDASDAKIALYLLDLNRFKEVNDTLGHATGDKVLIKVSETLSKQANSLGGCLFRLGGDEFVAVFDSINCTEPLVNIETLLNQSLKVSISIDDISIQMSASIGIAAFPENGKDSQELLRCADVAMYHAKQNEGVSSWYDTQNDFNNKRRLAMIVELESGIRDDQLVLHYQPRIHLKTGEITGCEALLRWQHPKLGVVPPYEFIPLAEMSELIHPLTEWVLKSAIAEIKRLAAHGYNVPVAMNISARNLTNSRFVDKLRELVASEGVDPRLLEIEITESALINHPQRAVENLEKLDKLGVPIAIDDFGTGYSSLSYLKKLPLNTLKIDRSFVFDMLTDSSDSVIVDSTIDLAHNFSLTVVAEGVEDKPTLDELAARGCDQAQGFFIAKPMPADAFEEWLVDYYNSQQSLRLAS